MSFYLSEYYICRRLTIAKIRVSHGQAFVPPWVTIQAALLKMERASYLPGYLPYATEGCLDGYYGRPRRTTP